MRRIRLFVSSPSDVVQERKRLQEIAISLNGEYKGIAQIEIFRWENEIYESHASFQDQIPDTHESDIVFSMFWTRLGAPLGSDFSARKIDGSSFPDGLTGSTYELLTAIDARIRHGRPSVFMFRKTEVPNFPILEPKAYEHARAEWLKVEAFLDEQFRSADGKGLVPYRTFESTDDFAEQAATILREWIERNVVGSLTTWSASRGNPFPGLEAYDADRTQVYFGRTRKVANAIRKMKLAAERGFPLLFIVGPSGAGKSSLMRAGLAPGLTVTGVVDGVDVWRVATMRPGEGTSLFHSLARSLIGGSGEGTDSAHGALRELRQGAFGTLDKLAMQLEAANEAALAPIVTELDGIAEKKRLDDNFRRPVQAKLLLLVDQFEDVFDGRKFTPEDRKRFSSFIKEALRSGRIWIACTLRADLYEEFIKSFIELQDRALEYALAAPGEAELAEIIEKSAAAVGATYDVRPNGGKSLDEVLLKEAKGAESLPLLQVALGKLYENRSKLADRTVFTFEAYDGFGGIRGAIDDVAEKALAKVFGEGSRSFDKALEKLVRALVVEVNDGKSATGARKLAVRPVPLAELPADDTTRTLVDTLVAARILVSSNPEADEADQQEGDEARKEKALLGATISLAHEKVLESWRRAKDLADKQKVFFQTISDLEGQWQIWLRNRKASSELIPPGNSLKAAIDLRRSYGDELKDYLRAYIDASARRDKTLKAGYIGIVVLLSSLLGVAVWFWDQSSRSYQEAQSNYRLARGQVETLIASISDRLENTYGIRINAITTMLEVLQQSIESLSMAKADASLDAIRADADYRFGKIYRKAGQNDGGPNAKSKADEHATRSLKIRQRLAAAPDSGRRMMGELASAHELMGDIHRDGGRRDEAYLQQAEALKIRRDLLRAEPNQRQWSIAVSNSLTRLGDLESLKADRKRTFEENRPFLEVAMSHYLEALTIAESITDVGHRGSDAAKELGFVTQKVGDGYNALERFDEARLAYERSICIRRPIYNLEVDNAKVRDDLAFVIGKLSRHRGLDNQYAQALAFEALRIRRQLARSDIGNANWTFFLAQALENVSHLKRERETTLAYWFLELADATLDGLTVDFPYEVRFADYRRNRIVPEIDRLAAQLGSGAFVMSPEEVRNRVFDEERRRQLIFNYKYAQTLAVAC